jgi:hypothetical protein
VKIKLDPPKAKPPSKGKLPAKKKLHWSEIEFPEPSTPCLYRFDLLARVTFQHEGKWHSCLKPGTSLPNVTLSFEVSANSPEEAKERLQEAIAKAAMAS